MDDELYNAKVGETLEEYSSAIKKYSLAIKEEDKEKQKKYLSEINSSIKRIKEIVPNEFKESIEQTINCLEELVYENFFIDFPNLAEL